MSNVDKSDNAVLEILADQLDEAAKIDKAGEPRKGATWSLAYVIQALSDLGYSSNQLKPLENLLFGLGDLGVGIQPDMLTKSDVPNAPKKGHRETKIHALAAVMIDVLAEELHQNGKKKGDAEKEAAISVSNIMQKFGLPFPGKSKTAGYKALLGWRKNNLYEQKNKIAVQHYSYFTQFINGMEPNTAAMTLRLRLSQI
jgi:hypothetical protein